MNVGHFVSLLANVLGYSRCRSGIQLCLALCIALAPAAALANDNPVHIQPKAPHDTNVSHSIRSDVELVLVPVTVTDHSDRLVTDLEAHHFSVLEENVPQPIHHFSSEDTPVSVAIVLDTSGSMGGKMERARDAVLEFLKTAGTHDEFLLVSFSDRPELTADLTTKLENIQAKLVHAVPQGETALFDAIYAGLHELRSARHAKRAMLIISDGGDNRSRYTHGEIREIVRESDVQVYAIGTFDRGFRPTEEERLGPLLLSEITNVTGGRTVSVSTRDKLIETAGRIGLELRNQYVLGYRPGDTPRDGKWKKIKVKLNPPPGTPSLRVSAKQGYYASED